MNEIGSLTELAGTKRILLLDFDGPICRLFGSYPAPTVADELRKVAGRLGVSLAGSDTGDPLVLLKLAYRHSTNLGRHVEDHLIRHEIRASTSATPTPGASKTVHSAHSSGRQVLVVSNNSERAVRTYLDQHGLSGKISTIVARPFARPDRMKPDPYLVTSALHAAHAVPADALFVGDSPTDMIAGNAAGVTCVGYARTPDRIEGLVGAHAAVVVASMDEFAGVWS